MTLTGLLVPNDEQVMVAWIKRYVGPDLGNAGVATALPKTLPTDGFITVNVLRAGLADVDVPNHLPLVTLDFWAAPLNSGGHPRWNAAAQLLGRVTRAMENDYQTFNKPLDLGAEYMGVRMQAVWKDNEPRRLPDDPSAYARYTLDVNAVWHIA
jgi:hypothetical protein